MKKSQIPLLLLLLLPSCAQRGKTTTATTVNNDSNIYLLVGTYTSGGSTGIYVYRFDTANGNAAYVSNVKTSNPSYLTVSSDERFVYSVGENDIKEATANAFAFDKPTGTLKFMNTELTKGAGPCYINTDNNGRFVVTANYSGGNVSVFPLADDGTLQPVAQVLEFTGTGPDASRQEKPHLHCVVFSPDQKFLFAADLGVDKVHRFEVRNAAPYLLVGQPDASQVEPGSGPRHLCFHPNGKYAYLLNELSGKVTVFRYSDGNLEAMQYVASDTTQGVGGKGSADIHVSPDGRFLYSSNRLKSDGIAIFSINDATGGLAFTGYQPTGIHPRNFIISPDGKFLLVANRDSNRIQVFERNTDTGFLTNTGQSIEINQPVCLKWINTH